MSEPSAWRELPAEQVPGTIDVTPELAALLRPGVRAVDLGCGSGRMLGTLRAAGAALAVGIDFNAGVLATPGLRGCVAAGDLTRLPLASGAFHVAVLQAALTCLSRADERRAAVAEAARVLRPGGRLYVAEFVQTPEVALYRDRYAEGLALTGEQGTFVVRDDRGAELFRAHHTTGEELVGLLDRAGLTIESSRETTFPTRSGNRIRGLVIVARYAATGFRGSGERGADAGER